jgi:hypothetical protein
MAKVEIHAATAAISIRRTRFFLGCENRKRDYLLDLEDAAVAVSRTHGL